MPLDAFSVGLFHSLAFLSFYPPRPAPPLSTTFLSLFHASGRHRFITSLLINVIITGHNRAWLLATLETHATRHPTITPPKATVRQTGVNSSRCQPPVVVVCTSREREGGSARAVEKLKKNMVKNVATPQPRLANHKALPCPEFRVICLPPAPCQPRNPSWHAGPWKVSWRCCGRETWRGPCPWVPCPSAPTCPSFRA